MSTARTGWGFTTRRRSSRALRTPLCRATLRTWYGGRMTTRHWDLSCQIPLCLRLVVSELPGRLPWCRLWLDLKSL